MPNTTESRESRGARAAAIREQQARKDRNRNVLLTVALVVVIGALIAAAVIFSGRQSDTTTADTSLPPATASGQALVVGSNDQAKTKVVVYEDFLCPYCRQFETSTRSFLHAAAKKGTVQVEYRPFHLLQDDYSTQALTAWAAVLQHGTPQQALRLHDLLYDNQPNEADPDKPGVSELTALAAKAGARSGAVTSAIDQQNQQFVDAADAAASQAGVKGTPTVFVNGKELQGASITDMADTLEQQVG